MARTCDFFTPPTLPLACDSPFAFPDAMLSTLEIRVMLRLCLYLRLDPFSSWSYSSEVYASNSSPFLRRRSMGSSRTSTPGPTVLEAVLRHAGKTCDPSSALSGANGHVPLGGACDQDCVRVPCRSPDAMHSPLMTLDLPLCLPSLIYTPPRAQTTRQSPASIR